MYLTVVNGRFTEQNNKSDMHNDKTKAVVAWDLNLGHLYKANMVTELPEIQCYTLTLLIGKITNIYTDYN